MRFLVAAFLLACGGSSENNTAPIPGGDQASPDNVPLAGEGEISARLTGRIEVPNFDGGLIQLDAVAEVDGQNHVVANERYEEPGEFRLVVRGEHKSVDIVVYLIAAGNEGPGAGDVRFDYPGNPVSLDAGGDVAEIADLLIEVVPVAEGEGATGPEGAPAGPPIEGGAPPMNPEGVPPKGENGTDEG